MDARIFEDYPTTTLGRFAQTHRVRTRRDGYGESIIPGKLRPKDMPVRTEYTSHLYEHGDGRLGLLLMFESKRRWGYTKRKLIAAGFEIRQDGHCEGTALFDPANASQTRLALELARIRPRRVLTQAHRQTLLSRLASARQAAGWRAAFSGGAGIFSRETGRDSVAAPPLRIPKRRGFARGIGPSPFNARRGINDINPILGN